MLAAQHGYTEIVESLLKAGAYVDLRSIMVSSRNEQCSSYLAFSSGLILIIGYDCAYAGCWWWT